MSFTFGRPRHANPAPSPEEIKRRRINTLRELIRNESQIAAEAEGERRFEQARASDELIDAWRAELAGLEG
jgi:hypothetical protein